MHKYVFLALLSLSLPAWSQSYVFTKIVDSNTQRPDGVGQFFITFSPPSYDGQWVVFREQGPLNTQALQAIWSFNTLDGTYRKLVDLKTPVPGGVGNFSDLQLLDAAPIVRNGTVIFVARD